MREFWPNSHLFALIRPIGWFGNKYMQNCPLKSKSTTNSKFWRQKKTNCYYFLKKCIVVIGNRRQPGNVNQSGILGSHFATDSTTLTQILSMHQVYKNHKKNLSKDVLMFSLSITTWKLKDLMRRANAFVRAINQHNMHN